MTTANRSCRAAGSCIFILPEPSGRTFQLSNAQPSRVVSCKKKKLRDGTWSKKVKAHYQVDYCTVLSQLFPQSDLSYWFPAVSEHIVPKGQWQFAKGLGFEVSHSRNGLLLRRKVDSHPHRQPRQRSRTQNLRQ